MQPTPAPVSSEARRSLEQLLSRLANSYVESLAPMERTLVRGLIRGRGWDLDRLASGRGPLAPVSDFGLAVLVRVFAEELNALDAQAGLPWRESPPPAVVDAALAELKGALS